MELKTEIWVGALIRRVAIGGAYATVARRGDRDAGAVLVKVATLDGRARLYAPALRGEGETVWLDLSAGALGDEERAVDAYARKRAEGDPDLWVVEIEDRAGRTFLTEPVDEGRV
ncbi:MAG TPA: DUF1491 family protein [Caulobacterales bacterium]|nr:DUF1491 family protein [Caulobacterales bacterium]